MLQQLGKEGICPHNYILIHPTSRWKFKCLRPAQMAELVQALHERGHSLVISAGPDREEMEMVEEILSLAPGIPVL